MTSRQSLLRLPVLTLGALAVALIAAFLAFGVPGAAAQTADTDADSLADDLERQLGSNPDDPDSTPENFALFWTCTDGNDNDRDGSRDFTDPGCRNTPLGATPTPAPTPPPGNGSGSGSGGSPSGGSGSTGGGSGSGGSSPADVGGSSGSGSGNAVFGGSGAPISDGSSGSERSGAGSQTGSGAGDQGAANGEAPAATPANTAGGAGAAEQDAIAGAGDDGGGFPWMLSLLILFGGLLLAAIIYAIASRRSALAGHSAPNRYQ